MNVIETMFRGDMFPIEKVKPDSPLFYEAKKVVSALSEKIHRELPNEYAEWFDAYCQASSEMVTETYLAFFRYGMQLGYHLGQELNEEV